VSASVLAPHDADAGVVSVYDNLSAAPGAIVDAIDTPFASFSTGKSSFTLLEIDLLLRAVDPASGDNFTVTLASDDGGAPGATIIANVSPAADLSPTLSVQPFIFFTPSNPIVLSPDTRYWVVLGGPGSVQWARSSDLSGVGVSGEFWGFGGSASPAVFSNECCGGLQPLEMQVAGSVPEPSSWALMLAGFGWLGLAGWRASRRRTPVL